MCKDIYIYMYINTYIYLDIFKINEHIYMYLNIYEYNLNFN